MVPLKQQFSLAALMLGGAFTISLLLYITRPPTELAEPEYRPVSVDAALVVRENLRIPVQAQGTVAPLRATSLQSEVSGQIIETAENFLVGEFIAKGDMLLRIDPRDYQTSLLRAQAAVKSAESNLIQEQGRAEVALREWQNLPKGSQRTQSATDLYLRKPQLEMAESQLLAAKADLQTAHDNLERTTIRAPYDALIRAKHSELGQYMRSGTPLAEIFSVDQAEVRLPIPQAALSYLDLPTGLQRFQGGTAVDLFTNVGGEINHWSARAHRTEAVFDERSRALYLVARIDDPYAIANPSAQALRMGTFVNANIEGREIPNLVALPRYILRAGNLLWVIDSNNVLRNREVRLLRSSGDQIYVSEGLDEGDLVCLTLMDPSFTGATVTIESTTATDKLRLIEQELQMPVPSAVDGGVSSQ